MSDLSEQNIDKGTAQGHSSFLPSTAYVTPLPIVTHGQQQEGRTTQPEATSTSRLAGKEQTERKPQEPGWEDKGEEKSFPGQGHGPDSPVQTHENRDSETRLRWLPSSSRQVHDDYAW